MEKIEQDNPKKILWYEVVDSSVTETTEEYYTDIYNAWETKEQLIIGQEVAEKEIKTGTIDTDDGTLQTVDNIYVLSVPDPDWEIFSIGIDWMTRTFYIWPFWSTALAYADLETELSDWLWSEYIVEYDTGTNFNLSRVDGQSISQTIPNLTRLITLNDWNTHTKLDIIIDGTTISIDWDTYATSVLALDYVVTQIDSNYYAYRDSNTIIIARVDWAIPVITETTYNRYTYDLQWRDSTIWPTSSELWWSDGSNPAKAYRGRVTLEWVLYEYTLDTWITWSSSSYWYDSPNIAWNPNWTIFNTNYRWSALSDVIYTWLTTWYTKSAISYTSLDGSDRNILNYDFYKDDRSQHTLSGFSTDYVIDNTLATATTSAYNWIDITETNHLATITVSTYTEIVITLTSTSFNYFIPTFNTPNKITIKATSSLWDSEGTYKRDQSCVAKYSSNTFEVADKIFKTSSGDYGNIVLVKRTWFVITWDTTVSNKLSWTTE